MPVYQVPQFLDSGDKIFGPLNPRQFIYALIGLFFNYFGFLTIQSIAPGLGFFALLPMLPTILLFGYLALGKYNGRDAEIYILKFILYVMKPRMMTYRRMPDYSDLNKRIAQSTPESINKRFEERVSIKKQIKSDEYSDFDDADALSKAQKIRKLGNLIDYRTGNLAENLGKAEQEVERKRMLIEKAHKNKFGEKDIAGVDDLISNKTDQDVNFFKL